MTFIYLVYESAWGDTTEGAVAYTDRQRAEAEAERWGLCVTKVPLDPPASAGCRQFAFSNGLFPHGTDPVDWCVLDSNVSEAADGTIFYIDPPREAGDGWHVSVAARSLAAGKEHASRAVQVKMSEEDKNGA